jgi:hypothetical protein
MHKAYTCVRECKHEHSRTAPPRNMNTPHPSAERIPAPPSPPPHGLGCTDSGAPKAVVTRMPPAHKIVQNNTEVGAMHTTIELRGTRPVLLRSLLHRPSFIS